MSSSSSQLLNTLLAKAAKENLYLTVLQQAAKDYQIKNFNIMKLTPSNIQEIYANIQSKFYLDQTKAQMIIWYENQLKIFVWVLVVYAFLENKRLPELIDFDYELLSSIFNGKQIEILEFQSRCLLRNKRTPKWSLEEISLIQQIINESKEGNRWNQIAKKMFIVSGKKYFRSPKQCREQWINHLDPSKSHCKWTALEDFLMLSQIMEHGKKWSKISKHLGGNRTEHMVKNRFKSLIKNQVKRLGFEGYDEHQQIVMSKIKQRLQCSITVRNYNNITNTQKTKSLRAKTPNKKSVIHKTSLRTIETIQQFEQFSQNKNIEEEQNVSFFEGLPKTLSFQQHFLFENQAKDQQPEFMLKQQIQFINSVNPNSMMWFQNEDMKLDENKEINLFFYESDCSSL